MLTPSCIFTPIDMGGRWKVEIRAAIVAPIFERSDKTKKLFLRPNRSKENVRCDRTKISKQTSSYVDDKKKKEKK